MRIDNGMKKKKRRLDIEKLKKTIERLTSQIELLLAGKSQAKAPMFKRKKEKLKEIVTENKQGSATLKKPTIQQHEWKVKTLKDKDQENP